MGRRAVWKRSRLTVRRENNILTECDIKYYNSSTNVLAYVSSLVADGARVLEIGPGEHHFSKATHYVDRWPGENITLCNVDREPLPFRDKEFDFIYCRHIVEDLHNPYLLLSEIGRVGKAGWIETPSPLAEVARGIDGTSPRWRGFHHHRWVVWEKDGILRLAGKYPLIEFAKLKNEESIYTLLRRNPFMWNTYHKWNDSFGVCFLEHEIHYALGDTYDKVLDLAITESIASTELFQKTIDLHIKAA